MIYLDTHIVVWYHANDKQRFSEPIQQLMNEHEWAISPMVRLELHYLHKIGRINSMVETILADLAQRAGLTICTKPFDDIVTAALQIAWTRDPFDRLIVGHAALSSDILITADQTIHAHYANAKW